MKKVSSILFYSFAIMGLFLIFTTSCVKSNDEITPPPMETSTITDIDGNVYKTVKIGTQWWMAENLKTTKFNDSSAIPLVTVGAEWRTLSSPGYCWYKNDTTKKNTYGGLYNWYAVNTGKLAPTGWHVPTDAEWTILTTYLGGGPVAGGKMKSTGTIEDGTGLWNSPNTGATNESGFTAVPAGHRSGEGTFHHIGTDGIWWSSSEYNTMFELTRVMLNGHSNVYTNFFYGTYGFSVRCVRDY
jgi:uncharacterized protein (TIGR02145 family)